MKRNHIRIIFPTSNKEPAREIMLPNIVGALVPFGLIVFTLLAGAIIAFNMSQRQYIKQNEPQVSYITEIENQLANKTDEIDELTSRLEDINSNIDSIASLQSKIHAMLDNESDSASDTGAITGTPDDSTPEVAASSANVGGSLNSEANGSTEATPNVSSGANTIANKFSAVNKVVALNKVFSLNEASEQTQNFLFIMQAHYDEVLDAYKDKHQHLPNMLPLQGTISSPFGYRPDPFNSNAIEFHNGVDLVAPYGTPVKASADGRIISAAEEGGWGLRVKIDHGYGIITFYAHLSQMDAQPGQEVKRGDIIGYLGNSGRSTGNHLHYGAFVNGQPFNPLEFLRAAAITKTEETAQTNPAI
ncbi:MAG: M23 family metallopeptidase [Peptococcaceae bacterium]|nr:M23 family metallopeptidase [Peptococcaceae bacterium]